jgi:threonine/homoserine/homoserine lactone efflux protein
VPQLDIAWPLFIVSSLVLIATPGQDMLVVMSRSLSRGSHAGVVAAAGVSLGLVGHTLLATLGLGALLRASEWLFTGLKLVGATYLVYLGIQALGAGQGSLRRAFADGALSNLSNPKIAIFYFAFLPQFVGSDALHPTLAIFVLGIAFAGLTFVVKAPVGVFAGLVSHWLLARPERLGWLQRCSGAILVALGVRLALEKR